jgi:hypothetical protein
MIAHVFPTFQAEFDFGLPRSASFQRLRVLHLARSGGILLRNLFLAFEQMYTKIICIDCYHSLSNN